MFRLTKEVVVAEFDAGGKTPLHEAMFREIGKDYDPHHEPHAVYRFEGIEVSILNKELVEEVRGGNAP